MENKNQIYEIHNLWDLPEITCAIQNCANVFIDDPKAVIIKNNDIFVNCMDYQIIFIGDDESCSTAANLFNLAYSCNVPAIPVYSVTDMDNSLCQEGNNSNGERSFLDPFLAYEFIKFIRKQYPGRKHDNFSITVQDYRGRQKWQTLTESELRERCGFDKAHFIRNIYDYIEVTNEAFPSTGENERIREFFDIRSIKVCISEDRLMVHRREILDVIHDLSDDIAYGIYFDQLCFDKTGKKWCDIEVAQRLLTLGMALGELSLPVPRAFWNKLEGKMAIVQRINPQEVK